MLKNFKRKTFFLITLSIIILAIFLIPFSFNLLTYLHKITPVGGELTNTKQIEKDLKYIYREEFTVNSVELFNIEGMLELYGYNSNQAKVINNLLKHGGGKVIQISLKDKKYVRIDNASARLKLTKQAINTLLYLNTRKFDQSIKAVHVFYEPKVF